ncbi:MAG: tetrahydromethanopterin S-methyltransferase subunit A [Euryarchaeota archaeon]|uniref:tetrahydromethanopterin S-methyltransferase subunit A n=1 Tax=Methanobacterium sp. MZD130B TaxID=3394378 RepID=UPI00175C0D32|nr:tetrahydromethanopterin S-methyltransferase subunit A [Methanobacterium sp.]MDI9436406.1 tetrahydromethanopterin S-methyltransferase subunit A [Euryarchaeota archaeon]HHT18084.1 tetrahydromethanopterin S-methyltransferase subunit A [Methanobacterium sp.]
MAEKKSPAEGWPVINGDYEVGDPESPVAATTLASHIESIPVDAGAAIAGPCKTENLGIEKMLANLISNPNIRFLILTGSEVQGHITGQSIEALHANGVDPEKRKIIDATGAIPFIENIPDEGIERFQQQMEIVSIIDVEDAATIQSKVKECIDKDPGAFEEEAMVIEVEEGGGEEEEGEEIPPVAPETALIEARMRNIQTQVKSIGGLNRMAAGMYSGKVQGIMIGLVFILTFGTLLLLGGLY